MMMILARCMRRSIKELTRQSLNQEENSKTGSDYQCRRIDTVDAKPQCKGSFIVSATTRTTFCVRCNGHKYDRVYRHGGILMNHEISFVYYSSV